MDIISANCLMFFSPPCVDFHSYLHHDHISIAIAKTICFLSICILSILQLLHFGKQYIYGADVDRDEDMFPQVRVHLNPC